MDRFDKFTDRARKVLTLAQDEAQRFNHNYIGTEHLLLGLIKENEGIAAQVLMNLGLKLEDVREEVLNLLGHGMEGPEAGERGGLGAGAGGGGRRPLGNRKIDVGTRTCARDRPGSGQTAPGISTNVSGSTTTVPPRMRN